MENNIKKAALLINSFAKDDEKWLLEKLKNDQTISYDDLLDEIGSLKKINNGEHLSFMATHIKYSDDFESCLKNIQIIDGANYKKIKEVLTGEPDWLVSSILSFYNWSWKGQYLKSVGIFGRYKYAKSKKKLTKRLSYKAKEVLVEGLMHQVKG